MKYKLILGQNATGTADDYWASFTFYTKSQAEIAAQTWIETANKQAWLFDGSGWTIYTS
jgi:hypothetical protein